MHFLYMIKNSSNKLYIGVTENPEKRLATHNSKRGAQYTSTALSFESERCSTLRVEDSASKNNSNFKIVFLEEYENLQQARKREIQIKKWSRAKKEMLIERYKNHLPTKL